MYFIASINAYDAIGNVVVSAVVRETTGALGDSREPVVACVTTVQGIGEDDPRQWLRDALVALLEDV